jgi:hypothetical protein
MAPGLERLLVHSKEGVSQVFYPSLTPNFILFEWINLPGFKNLEGFVPEKTE